MSRVSRWVKPVFNYHAVWEGIRNYRWYIRDWQTYQNMPNSEGLTIEHAYPFLYNKVAVTPFDSHYFYQDIWAFKHVLRSGTSAHVDVASRDIYAGMLTAITQVTFIDIRPLNVTLDNFDSRKGSILDLPFDDNSVPSLSCLHVAEHIGLGRYGDPLDPLGTKKACAELQRVLAPGGELYFSLPVGRHRVQFNAHRVHPPQMIIEYFSALELVGFAAINDTGQFFAEADPDDYSKVGYSCGLFHFKKGA